MNIRDALALHRRGVVVTAIALAAVMVLLGAVVVAARLTAGDSATAADVGPIAQRTAARTPEPAAPTPRAADSPSAPASDVASWDAIAPVVPRVSAAYPAIGSAAAREPFAFARAFVIELFTRNYVRAARADLLAWVQYENSPLRSPSYPRADWTKVLVDSLTDPTWDDATDTSIPAEGPWLALQAAGAKDTVSHVRATPDPVWQQRIASGYEPPDRLATAIDVTLTVTRQRVVGGRATTSRYAVALALQLGTSVRGASYGVAAANNYVIKEMG